MKQKLLLILAMIVFLFFPTVVNAKNINIYLFYGKECPHCEKERSFLTNYLNKEDKSNVKLYEYEVWYNRTNQKIWQEVQATLDVKAKGVPYLVIGQEVISGYMEDITDERIIETIGYYEKNDYQDIVGEMLGYTEKSDIKNETKEAKETFKLPILGEVKAKEVSLPLVAAVIGFVDGFNPCAMWVLLFLISMLLGMKNKKRMWALGLSFILTSGIIYLLFMVSWLNFATLTSKVVLIRILIGIFATIFGIINIYKYGKNVKQKEVGCDVTGDSKRKKIMTRIKNITSQQKFILALLGIIILAISVNMIELLCSLGLPLIFTQLLAINNLSVLAYCLNLFIYILFFLLDDILIFAIAMKTLEIKAVSAKYGKYSHLIGGIIMFIIGILMIIKPEWLMFTF